MKGIGVSPAYFLSKFGRRFSPEDLMGEMPLLSSRGFTSLQVELTEKEAMNDWNNASVIQMFIDKCAANNIVISQVVAHFWIDYFESSASLSTLVPKNERYMLIHLASVLPGEKVLTIPFPCFQGTNEERSESIQVVKDELESLSEEAARHGVRIAAELQPGHLFGTIANFQNTISRWPFDVFYNLDTGHVNAAGEDVPLIVKLLGKRIIGTHLCDNDSVVNDSLCPGKGNISWKETLDSLNNCAPEIFWDLEIMCSPSAVESEYSEGKQFLLSM